MIEKIKIWQENQFKSNAIEKLVNESKFDVEFFVMCWLSWLFAMSWILLNDTVVIIAAMVLAPLMNPILSFAAWIILLSRNMITYALKSLFWSIAFILTITALWQFTLNYMWYDFDISLYIIKFSEFNFIFLITAFLSWFAGVYSWLKEIQSLSLVWVAIAVSLVPFVSFLWMLIWNWDFELIKIVYINFLLNLLFIIWWACIAFVILWVISIRKSIIKNTDDTIENLD